MKKTKFLYSGSPEDHENGKDIKISICKKDSGEHNQASITPSGLEPHELKAEQP